MAVAPGQVIQVTLRGEWPGGDEAQQVIYLVNDGDSNAADADVLTAADLYMIDAYNDILTYVSNSFSWLTIRVYNITQDKPIGDQALSTTVTGTSVTQPLPYQCSGLVSFPTKKKKTVGKKYIPGLTEGAQDDANALLSAAVDDLQDLGDTLVDGFTAGGQEFIPGTYNLATQTFTKFESAIARGGIYTQRRRRPGVGA